MDESFILSCIGLLIAYFQLKFGYKKKCKETIIIFLLCVLIL